MYPSAHHSTKPTGNRQSHRLGVEMPITEQLYAVLFEGLDPKMTIAALMQRPKKNETEKDFLGEGK